MQVSKILITGGAGFLGYFLTKKLSEDKDNNITILDNLSRGQMDRELQDLVKQLNIRFIRGDLTDITIFEHLEKNYDYIYHLAAIVGVKNVTKNPDKVLYVNTISALNIFEYTKNLSNLKKMFYSSTSEVYSGTSKHYSIRIPTDERVHLTIEDIKADRTTYALSKIYGESLGFVYGRKYNIPIIIGRYHNIYGPRMGYAHVIPEMIAKISNNDIVDVPSPSHSRAFCFIDDAVEFTVRACKNDNTKNDILHIGNSKEEIKIRDLVLKIADILEKDITINELPNTPGSPERRCPNTTKIEKLTGYSPKIHLNEGIRKTYEWYKDKLDMKNE